ncbi:hypothetical protein [Aestuariibaculum suncheonense]|uniref:Uncharacterized protein n=1 Tax=Aestuariibaculum suncheonense TaxID=1028745 RepID=A0A8J6U9Y2_9FLAO|nr:hypothetical protein [Aestuariibaculum suncheonense]MBD0834583.1 hypothetical protein [Aestuariibaculum suncheonense]
MNNNCGFRVSLNDELLTNAGLEDQNFIISCILNSFRREHHPEEGLELSVSGLISETQQHVKWVNSPLKRGDKITIEVIDNGFDQPVSISESKSEEELLKGKLRAYHKLKEELKDYI